MSNGGQHLLPYWHSSADPAVVPRPAPAGDAREPTPRSPRAPHALIFDSIIGDSIANPATG